MNDLLSLNLEGLEFATYPTFEYLEEVSVDIQQLHECFNVELILEKMQDANKSTIDKVKSINGPLKATRDTTKDVVKSYNTLTDTGGTLLKSVWDLVTKAMQLAVKVARFILLNLSKIPKAILDVGKTFLSIPPEIKAKVRGDIKLYITVEDLNNLHKIIIPQIDTFLKNAHEMSKGDAWGTFWRRRAKGTTGIAQFIFTENDIAYYKKMKAAYTRVQKIDFNKSLVKIADQNIIDIYFGDAKSIKYKNADRGIVESNYYDALVEVFNIIQSQSEYINTISKDFDTKMDLSTMNQSLSKASESTKNTIIDAIRMNAKMINIIGNLMQYTIHDMNTLKGVAKKLLNAAKVKRVKTP